MQKNKMSMRRKLYIACMKGFMIFSVSITAALVIFLVSYVMMKGIKDSY